MATIDDIAQIAGVSKMTVSRVINNSGSVSEKTRIRVLDAIQKTNYRPNMMAKGLATKRSHAIAHVMVNISDPFHNLVSQGIEHVSYRRGYTTMVCDTHTKNRERDYINALLDRSIDGAVFHHLAITPEIVNELEDSGVWCVMLDNEARIATTCNVETNNFLGAYMATKHLIDRGHRSIACVCGIMQRPDCENPAYEDTFQFNIWRERTRGYQAAMAEHALRTDRIFQSNGLSSIAFATAGKTVDTILQSEDCPSALYCENDMMAIACMNALMERNIRVPEDMAVIGHDGLELSRMLHPYITTIEQPRFEMGRRAAELLINRIEGDERITHEVLDPTLYQGETT